MLANSKILKPPVNWILNHLYGIYLIGVNREKEPLSGTAPERRLFDRSLYTDETRKEHEYMQWKERSMNEKKKQRD